LEKQEEGGLKDVLDVGRGGQDVPTGGEDRLAVAADEDGERLAVAGLRESFE
jgi:hypothetical protein